MIPLINGVVNLAQHKTKSKLVIELDFRDREHNKSKTYMFEIIKIDDTTKIHNVILVLLAYFHSQKRSRQV